MEKKAIKDIGTIIQFSKHEGAQLKQNEDGSFVYLSVDGKKGDIRVDYRPYIGREVSVTHSQTKNPKGETVNGKLVEVLTNDGIDTLIISDGHDLKWIVAENVIEFRTL